MGWQRFNRSTNVFEVSDNNGASWQVLQIAAAGLALGSNIAYTNVANIFTQKQEINSDAAPALILGTTGTTRPALRQSVADQLDVVSADNARWITVNAGKFVSANAGNSLGDLSVRGGTALTQDMTINGSSPRIHIVNDGGAANTKRWELCSSGGDLYFQAFTDDRSGLQSYILFSRAGNLVLPVATGSIYERGRGYPMGEWNAFTTSCIDHGSASRTIGSQTCRFTIVGKTVFLYMYAANITTGAYDAYNLLLSLPPGVNAAVATSSIVLCHRGTGQSEACIATVNTNGWIYYTPLSRAAFPANYNANHIYESTYVYQLA